MMNSNGYSYESSSKRYGFKLFIVISLMIVFGCLYFMTTTSNKEYISQEGRFRVCYFAAPHQDIQIINDAYYTNVNSYFTTEHSATTYHCHVWYVDFPENLIQQYNTEGIFDIAQNYIVRPSYQVTARSIIYDGYRGRELRLDTLNDGIAVCRMFLQGNRLYRVLIANKDKEKMSDPKVNEFLNSFHIMK